MEKDYTIIPEFWAQPGTIQYHYVHNAERTLWNIDRIADNKAFLWSVNSWGGDVRAIVSLDDLRDNYSKIEHVPQY